jgi:selenocysteine lyase/cysteine desulfurase
MSHRNGERNRSVVARLADAGIDVALRGDNIRLSAHLYNSESDIDAFLEVLGDEA